MIYKYFRCPKCRIVSSASAWNSYTIDKVPPNKKKLVRTCFKKIQFSRNEPNRYYNCPGCGRLFSIKVIEPVVKSDLPDDDI